MAKVRSLLVGLVVLTATMYETDALTCYHDVTPGAISTTCTYCQRAVSTGATTQTVRSCVNACVPSSGAFGGSTVTYSCCQTDYCNGNAGTTIQINIIAALLTTLYALWYLQ
jgi:hypothetical protein